MSRTRFPNTARRIAIACGFSGDGIGTRLPNTFARFAAQLGITSTKTRFPNTMERLCAELEAGAASYVGPLDLVPGAVMAYSAARALSAARIGQNVIRLRRASDDAELNFAAAADGTVDVAAIAAWASGDAFCHTLFDQSGNGADIVCASDQPKWSATAQGGKPGLISSGGGVSPAFILSTELSFPNGEFTLFYCGEQNAAIEINFFDVGYIYVQRNRGEIADATGNNVAGATYPFPGAGWHVLDGAWAFGSHSLRLDGVEQSELSSLDEGEALSAFTLNGGNFNTAQVNGTGDFGEFCMYPVIVAAGGRTAVDQNQAAYYGL